MSANATRHTRPVQPNAAFTAQRRVVRMPRARGARMSARSSPYVGAPAFPINSGTPEGLSRAPIELVTPPAATVDRIPLFADLSLVEDVFADRLSELASGDDEGNETDNSDSEDDVTSSDSSSSSNSDSDSDEDSFSSSVSVDSELESADEDLTVQVSSGSLPGTRRVRAPVGVPFRLRALDGEQDPANELYRILTDSGLTSILYTRSSPVRPFARFANSGLLVSPIALVQEPNHFDSGNLTDWLNGSDFYVDPSISTGQMSPVSHGLSSTVRRRLFD